MITNLRSKMLVAMLASCGIVLSGCNSTSIIGKDAPAFFLNERGEISATDIDLKKTSPIKYSFTHEPYIHPKIIQELSCCLADSRQTITAIDLEGAMKSNRFCEEVYVREFDGKKMVGYKEDAKTGASFEYEYIGTSPSGIHILECSDCGGGSSIFRHIVFLSFQSDNQLEETSKANFKIVSRTCLRKLGEVSLGDRYDGKIKYANNILNIGIDKSPWKFGPAKEIILNIK